MKRARPPQTPKRDAEDRASGESSRPLNARPAVLWEGLRRWAWPPPGVASAGSGSNESADQVGVASLPGVASAGSGSNESADQVGVAPAGRGLRRLGV